MVAASEVYHSKVAEAILAMAMFEAKKAVKRQLQAEGKKISWYLPKDITRMAQGAASGRSLQGWSKQLGLEHGPPSWERGICARRKRD